ncbi:MAG: hypothetical protein ACRDQZ_05460, partial [Mycobacteriales bacterium]
ISDIDPVAFRVGVASRKERVEAAEDDLRIALEAAGRSDQLMLLQGWDNFTRPEKKRWLNNVQVSVAVARGRQPLIERATMTRESQPLDLSTVVGLAGIWRKRNGPAFPSPGRALRTAGDRNCGNENSCDLAGGDGGGRSPLAVSTQCQGGPSMRSFYAAGPTPPNGRGPRGHKLTLASGVDPREGRS